MSGGVFVKPTFHAPFLDGLRGFAALAVVYDHSDTDAFFPDKLMDGAGRFGVVLFFVLSSFLLTYLSLVDWERWWHSSFHSASHSDRIHAKEKADDLLVPHSQEESSSSSSPSSSLRLLSGIKLWGRYFVRRIFRVYPPYLVVLILIVISPFIRKSFLQPVNMDKHLGPQPEQPFDFWASASLSESSSIFGTIPVEIMYYFIIPIVVISYVLFAELFSRVFNDNQFGYIVGRLIVFATLLGLRIHLSSKVSNMDYDISLINVNTHVFMDGSLGAILYRELQRYNLIPLSEAEEKKEREKLKQQLIAENNIEDEGNNINNDASLSIPQQGQQPPNVKAPSNAAIRELDVDKDAFEFNVPSKARIVRVSFDVLAWVSFVVMAAFNMPYYGLRLFDVTDAKYLKNHEQMWYASIPAVLYIIFALLSRSGTSASVFEWHPLRVAGRWSFSIYLLHLIPLNNYAPFLQLTPFYIRHSPGTADYAMDKWDEWCVGLVVAIVISWLFHITIETWSMNAGLFIIKRWMSEPPTSKSHPSE